MHPLLERLFKKKNLTLETLSVDEKTDYDRWRKILSEGDITVERIEEFCRSQNSLIESQWRDLNNEHRKNDRLLAMHVVYSSILTAIKAPKIERERLEQYLTSLIEGV